MGQKRNHKKLEDTVRWMKKKTQHTNTYGMQLKQFLEGNLWFYHVYIKKKEKPYINNLNFLRN